jgi:hypothetical protein
MMAAGLQIASGRKGGGREGVWSPVEAKGAVRGGVSERARGGRRKARDA